MNMIRALKDVSAFQPPISGQLNDELRALTHELFTCPEASHDPVRRQLAKGTHDVFFNTAVRERLVQGRGDPVIDGVLGSTTTAQLRAFLAQVIAETSDVADRINRYPCAALPRAAPMICGLISRRRSA
mgnify:CR=1 FL=1